MKYFLKSTKLFHVIILSKSNLQFSITLEHLLFNLLTILFANELFLIYSKICFIFTSFKCVVKLS